MGVLEHHPALDGVECTRDGLEARRDGGTATFAVETPGDMARVRFGLSYASDPGCGWDLLVSFDVGKTWQAAGSVKRDDAPCLWVTFSDVPRGARKALVRYRAAGSGTNRLTNFRIDADYAEPAGGFRPVRVTYVWLENGVEKRDVHVAQSPSETYAIHCDAKPVMRSLITELAD